MAPSFKSLTFSMLDLLFGDPSEGEYEETFQEYQLPGGQTIHLKLVGEHSLWAHKLWNAAKVLADKICKSEIDVNGKRVLELGAGASLPSITSALFGASYVLCTDYPEDDILQNMAYNAQKNGVGNKVTIQGLLWSRENTLKQTFDHIFMADLIFNHREHDALAAMVKHYLADDGVCHVLYSHHVPLRRDRDLQFFSVCAAAGLVVTQQPPVFTDRMFPEDDAQFSEYPLEWRQYVYYQTITKPHLPSE